METSHEQRTLGQRILKIETELCDIRKEIRDLRTHLNNGWKEDLLTKMGSEIANILRRQHSLLTKVIAITGGSTGILALMWKLLS